MLAPLAAVERTTRAEVEAAARDLGIGRAYCYRLLRRLRAERTVTAVLPRSRGRRVGARILGNDIERIIGEAIDEFYLDRQRPSVAVLVREIARRCAERGLTAPSYKAVAPRVRALDRREVVRRREGAAAARSRLGLIVGRLSEDKPLGLVQIDHTLADVFVVSQQDRRVLCRPWLTLAIDVATRMVAGFYLSLDPPSALSVSMVLSQAVLPKGEYLQGREVDLAWPVSGLPARLHLDNAKEFRAQALRRGAAQYGIELEYRPPATPHWGGHIERLIGTMMGALRLLPGATGGSVATRGDDPEGRAVMTLDELETWLVHQITGVYHHSIHRGLGKPPIVAWTEAVAELEVPHRQPPDPDRFYLDFLPFQLRTVQRRGVSLFNITYSDGVLSTFLAKPHQKFVVRYDPRDMSRVYLRDPDGIYWTIPYSDVRQAPATLAEVRAASRRLLAAGEKHPTQRQVFASMAEQRALVEEAATRTQAARRERERTRRALHRGASSAPAARQPCNPEPDENNAGPVLPFPVEEWS
ncbi:Mu transposase C-terminal domain-containing protein [Roseomonas xinghualingensis]|uniref:Mu transposase C-terminal domain-containing protein n=1 Tax=Roseomonas xinghualingensis TaxID=2986475 RepID=UPI00367056E3